MKGRTEWKRVRDLVRLYDGLRFLNEELLAAIESKIAAMRTADVTAIRSACEAEEGIVARLREREGLRLQLMEAIAGDLGLATKEGRSMTASSLASRLPEPESKLVAAAAEKLRGVMARSAQANRLASSIAREIVQHMKCVFDSVRPREESRVGYTGFGRAATSGAASLFETVG